MTRKTPSPKKVEAVARKPCKLFVVLQRDESPDHATARAVISPHFGAARTIMRYAERSLGDLPLNELIQVLGEQAAVLSCGDLSNVEAVLSSQATTLDMMFAELARKASLNMGEYLGAAETFMKLALRAQSQCRATLETLAAIKNPPMVFAKQANFAHGHQQVNNGTAVAHAGQTEKAPTELLEHNHGERLDTGAATAAGRSDPAVATVVEIHRPAQRRRKGRIKP